MMMGLVMGLGSVTASAEGTNAFAGRQVFDTYCFVCHGMDGKGNGPLAKQLPKDPANLADNSKMMNRTDKQLAQIVEGTVDHGLIRGKMPRWNLALSPIQIQSVVAYIRVLHSPTVKVPGNPENGQKVYNTYCVACHGANGKGDGAMAKVLDVKPADHTNAKKMAELSNGDLHKAIADGTDKMMPAWKGILSDKEIDDVLGYIRLLSN
jgi:cytochrome c oxidase cbb3-type subunit 3